MAEADARRQRELAAVRLVPGREFLARRLARGILGEELYFLRHAAPDDCVVLVKAERECFAIEDFFAHSVLDQDPQFLWCRIALPVRPEH